MDEFLRPIGFILLIIINIILSSAASLHAVLKRRDPLAASSWMLWAWLFPLVGPTLYYFFGINRIERKASRLRSGIPHMTSPSRPNQVDAKEGEFTSKLQGHLIGLSKLVGRVVQAPLREGNLIKPLINGDEAYPDMIHAIHQAEKSIGLSTYIFNHDRAGKSFITALTEAAARGVQVRVLIDDVGSGYSWGSVHHELERRGVPVAYFMPSRIPWRMAYLNLRNHRKILTVDGRIGYTGGLNIHESNLLALHLRKPTRDVHFRVEGPVVAQIQDAFQVDWNFTTGERLGGPDWFPDLPPVGPVFARGIPDGPDEDFEKTKWTILAALTHARSSVRIMTPYLIPDASLISALGVAAMSGVRVDIVLPQATDMKLVQWATQAVLWQVLERGCRVWLTPPPFDHTKLMVVDQTWTLFGSTNWDRRSLRLNFEFNMESYEEGLALQMDNHIAQRMAEGREVTLADVDSRPMWMKFRDGFSRLLTPFI